MLEENRGRAVGFGAEYRRLLLDGGEEVLGGIRRVLRRA